MWILDFVWALCVTPLIQMDARINSLHAHLALANLTGNERKFYAYQLSDLLIARYCMLEDVPAVGDWQGDFPADQ